MHIGKAIYKFRIDKKLTVEELSLRSNVEKSFLIGVENGKYDPTFNILLMLCKGLGITVQELIGVTENKLFDDYQQVKLELENTLVELNKLEQLNQQLIDLQTVTESDVIQFTLQELNSIRDVGVENYYENDDKRSYDAGVSLGQMISTQSILIDLKKKFGIE